MNLGELIVELSADSSDLEKTLERAKKKAYEAAMSVEKSFEKINLNINVDDDSLTDLNKHLNLKVQHLKEVNKYFNNNPIVVNVDDSQLTDLNKHLHIKVQHLKQVNKYYDSNPIKINTDTTRLDDLEERLGKLTNKTITITVESDLSNQLEKSLVAAVKEAVKDGMQESSVAQQQQASKEASSQDKIQNVNVVASPGRAVLEGIFDGLGKGFTQGINKGIEDAVGVDIPTMTRISSNMMLRYFGVGKKAQSDPKNEQKRVEAILKDGVDTFIKVHDANTKKSNIAPQLSTTVSQKTAVTSQPVTTLTAPTVIKSAPQQKTAVAALPTAFTNPSATTLTSPITVVAVPRKVTTTSTANKVSRKQSNLGLDDDLGVDFEAAGGSAARGLLRFFGIGKKAQSDPKEEKARIEAIIKGMVDDYSQSQSFQAPAVVTNTLSGISNTFLSSIDETLEGLGQQSKVAVSKAVRKSSQGVLNKAPAQVQKAANALFNEIEGRGGDSFSQVVGKQLATVTKSATNNLLKTILPNTYSVVKKFISTGGNISPIGGSSSNTGTSSVQSSSIGNSPVPGSVSPINYAQVPQHPSFDALGQASQNLSNAAQSLNEFTLSSKNTNVQPINQSDVIQQVATQELQTPLDIPLVIHKKTKKAKKEKEPELVPIENTANAVSPQLKKYIQDVRESTLSNIELSKQYAQATAKENDSPLALDIKKKQDISLKDVKAKFDAIKKYFAEEYKRLLLEFNEVKLTGTVEDIKAVKNKLIAFKSASKSAIADIDATVKEAEKAGYDKKINSPLTEIHKSGKQGISRNANEAGRKADQLKNEEVDIFNKQLKKYAALAEEKGIDVVEGLKKGIANKSTGVSDQARKMLDDLIETVESRMKIQSPSLVMFEVGMMIASGLFLGMQKGNSQVAVGARQLVSTIKSAVGSAKEILEPALAIGSVVPGVSTAATYGSVGLAATDSGLKMLNKVGERHAANPDQTLFQSAFGSGKDFIAELRADKTLTKPREAFDHFINLSKAGAATLGVNSFTTFDAAQSGMTALLRSSAAGKAVVQSHGETKYRLAQDPSLDYMTTYKAVLTDKLKDLKLTKPEIIKAIGSALKVVPTGFGTAANSVAETAGMVLADGIDALTIPRNLYRNISSKTAQGVTHQQAIAESITDLGAPVQVANAIGSFGDKHSVSLNAFARMSGNVVENINKALINTVAASSKVVSSSANAISHQVQKNMGHELPTQQSVAQPSSQSISSAAVASNSVSAKPFASIGGNIMKGLGKGMADSIGSVTKVMDNAGNAIQSQIKQNMGIQSPSKVMIALGLMISSGLAIGISSGAVNVSGSMKSIIANINSGVEKYKNIKQFLSQGLDKNATNIVAQTIQSLQKDFGENSFVSTELDKIKNVLEGGIGKINNLFLSMPIGKGLNKIFNDIEQRITEFNQKLTSKVKIIFESSNNFKEVGAGFMSAIGQGIISSANQVKTKILDSLEVFLSGIISPFADIIARSDNFSEFGVNLFSSIGQSIKNSFFKIQNLIIGSGAKIKDVYKNVVLSVQSAILTSNNFKEFAVNLFSPIGKSIANLNGNLLKTIGTIGKNILASAKNIFKNFLPDINNNTVEVFKLAPSLNTKNNEDVLEVFKLANTTTGQLTGNNYNKLANLVLQLTGKTASQQEIPLLGQVDDPNFLGSYQAKFNLIRVSKENFKNLMSSDISQLSDELIDTVLHEMFHAVQQDFGKVKLQEASKFSSSPTLKDMAKWSGHIEASVAPNRGRISDPVALANLELGAYTFADKYFKTAKDALISNTSLTQSITGAGNQSPKEVQQAILKTGKAYYDTLQRLAKIGLPRDVYMESYNIATQAHGKAVNFAESLDNIGDLSPEETQKAVERFTRITDYINSIPATYGDKPVEVPSQHQEPKPLAATATTAAALANSSKLPKELQQTILTFKQIYQDISSQVKTMNLPDDLYSQAHKAIEKGYGKGTELIEVLDNIQDLSPEQVNLAMEKFNQYSAYLSNIPVTINKLIGKPDEVVAQEQKTPVAPKASQSIQQSEFFRNIRQVVSGSANLKELATNIISAIVQNILSSIRKHISSFVTKITASFTDATDQPIEAFKQNLPQQASQALNNTYRTISPLLPAQFQSVDIESRKWESEFNRKLNPNQSQNKFNQYIPGIPVKSTEVLTNVHRAVSPILPIQFQANDFDFHKQLNSGNSNLLNNPAVNQVVNTAKKLKSTTSFKEIGSNLISSLGQGFLSVSSGVLGIVTAFAKGILSAIKKVFRIASPSGEGIDVGENIAGSTGTGIDNQAHRAVEAARNMAEDISEAMIPDPWDMRFSPNPVFQQDLDLENQAQAQIRATRERLQKSMIQDLLSNTGVNFGSDFNHEGIASSVLSSSQLIRYLNSNFANLNPLQQMGFSRLAADFDNQKTNAAHQFAIARTSGTTLDSATIRGFDSSFNTMLNRIVAFSKQLGIKSTEIDRLLASNQSKVTTEVYQPPKFVAPKTSIPERQLGQTDQEYSEAVKRALAEDNNNYRTARNAYNRMILGISDTPVPQKTQFPMLPPVPVYAREIIDDVPSVAYTTPDPWNNSVQPNLQKIVEQIKPQSILPPAKAYRDIDLLLTSTQSNLQKLGRDVVSSQLRTQLPQQNLSQAFVPISNSGVQQLLLPPAKAYRDINLLLTSTQSNLQKLGRNIVSSQSRTQLPPQQTQLPPQRITSPLILPNSVANNPNAKLILPKTATPKPDAQIISPQNFTANPNAKLILPVVQGLVPAVRSTHSLAQNSISTLTNTNKQIRVNLDALRSGNKNLVFSRYAPIPDPWLTPSPAAQASRQSTMQSVNRSNQLATGQISATLPSAILSFISQNPPTAIPGYSVPTVRQNIKSIASLSPNIPFVPPATVSSSQPPNIPPVPPTTTSSSQPQPPNIPPTLMNQYLSLGTDLVTNMFKAVNASIRQSTLSGYASLGQVMRNAVNAALFSLSDTLRKPLHQALMSQTRSILPWFMKFIPRGFQLLPKLSFAIPFVGGMVLRLGNSIIKNLLENNILKEGGFLTNLLSSITRINLSALSGTKTAGITGFLKNIASPVPTFVGSKFNPFLSLGLGAASPLYDAFSGILGLDESTKPNPKKQAPTIEKVLQDQTKANREKAKIRDFAGAEASKELVETLGNTLVDNVLESLDIPLIPKSAVQIMMGKKLGQRSATIADSINALGVQKSKTEQLLERAVQSGKATPERIDRLTRMALRERGIVKSARNAMTADELAAARDNILNNSLDATKREREFLQFEGDLEVNTTRKGTSATQRTRDAKLIRILRERGVSNADITNIRQSGNGLNDVAADLVNNPRTTNKGFVGKLTEAYAANDQDAMKELVKQGLRKTGMSSKQIDNIDPKLLDTATAGIMTTLSGLQAKFKEKGFNMGKALAKGFKDSMVNLANAKDDLEYNAKKALGQANFGDSVGLIFRRMFRGTVATQDQFKEMYNQMGAGVKKALFRDPNEGDEMFPNILQFLGSIGTTLAPITTMVGAITPLLLPLAPIITGIGMSVNMVMPHIARLIDGIQRVEILQRRFKFLGGSAEGGQAEFNYAKDMASKYNVPSEVAANSYSQLAIAARDSKMEGQGVKELFEGITASLSALGITGQDASLVFMAYTQILSKGKLSMEELRQQLGEKFPPAMGVFAKAMGVSVPEMNALVSSGGVLSQDILPKVAKVLKEDYGNAAANQAGGLVVALNKLGNVGFEITTIFTDKLGGTLGFFVGSFADILGVLSGALKELIPLGQSFMIGFAATISIGLTIILSKFKPFLVAIGSLQSFLLATFSTITTNMMPMIVGVTADVADGWMGAEKNLMDNMTQGITNMFVSILGNIDSIMRSMSGDQVSFTSMFGGLIQGAKEAGNIVEWLKGIFTGFFKIIPAGFVELLAMVFMFEQGTGLAVMALGPAIKGLWGGLTGMFKSTWGAFQGLMSSLKGLNELMMTSMGLANAAGHGAEGFAQRRAAALNATLAFLKSALMHVAIAYGILMFSKGDFSDPMRESINKNTADINKHLTEVRVNINKTTEAFNKATKSVSELGNSIRDALPAKGVQLDIRSLWGGGDWKWDDAVRATNRRESPGFMDVVGPGALATGGAVAGLAALAAVAAFATKASAGIAATLAAIQGVAGVGATKAAILIASQTSIGLMPRLLGILVPMLASPLAPWVAAIAGFVTALLVAAAALDLFAPKLTKEQYNELPQEIKDIINVRDPANNPGDRLDSASQQVIKLHKDQVLNNQRLTEFAKSVGLDGNINNFIAPSVKAIPEQQRKEFEKTDSAKNINTEITDTKERLKGIENIGKTDVEKSAQRDKPIYKGVQEKLAQLEKNKRLLELQFMVNYNNKGEIDKIDQQIKTKEKQISDAKSAAEKAPAIVGLDGNYAPSAIIETRDLEARTKELKALQQQKAQLQTNLNATVQRRLDFDQIKAIDVRLKKAVDEFIDLDEKLKFNPNDELRSKAGLKKELVKQLRKQREKLLDSFGDPTPWLKKALKSVTDEIAQTQARVDITEGQRKNTINNLRKYQEQLEKMLATVSKFGDISDLTGALYTKASNALKDAETKYNTDISKNKVASNQAQTRIYGRTNLTAQQIAPDLSNQQINDLVFQQKALEKSLATKITSLREYRAVLVLGPSDPGAVQAEIDKLQQDILKDKEQISQNILDIAKARRDANQVLIDQTKQVAEYYRASVREAETATIEYKKAIVSIKNQQFANRLRQALIGAGNNIVTEFVDTLINLFQQLSDIENINIDQQKQKLDYRNSIQDIEIKATELQRSLPGKIIPFDSNKINQYNQQLKGVGGTVLDINKEIQRINKMLGMDAVNSTMGFNAALERVVFTLTKIKNLAPSIPNPGNNTPKNRNDLYIPYKNINNPAKKPDPFDGLSLPTKSSNVPSVSAIASTPREILVAGITSDVGYLPAVSKSPYLIAQATTPKSQQPKAIPSNAIVSPVSDKNISEFVRGRYSKGWNSEKNQSIRILGDANVLAAMTGTLKKINGNTVELQRVINGKDVRFRYVGLNIDKDIKFSEKNLANVKAGQVIGTPILDAKTRQRLFDFSASVKDKDGKTKFINAQKFYNNIVELKRVNPLTKFFNWATGNHIDPAVQGLNLAPQDVDPSWFKQVTSFAVKQHERNMWLPKQGLNLVTKAAQSLQGKGSSSNSQNIPLATTSNKITLVKSPLPTKTPTKKTTTKRTTNRKPVVTTNPKPKTAQDKSRELTGRANRGGTDSPNNNQGNVTKATNIKAGATRQNTEAQIRLTEEQKRRLVTDFLRGLNTSTIQAQNNIDDANLRKKQEAVENKKRTVSNNPMATEEEKDRVAYMEKDLEFERTRVDYRKRLRGLQAPLLSNADFDRIQKQLSSRGIKVDVSFLKRLYTQLRSANAQESATVTANLRDLEKRRPQWLKDFAEQQSLQREVNQLNRKSDSLGVDTGVLQSQLELLKQIETSRPLDPKMLEIPKTEYEIGIMQAEAEKLRAQANLLQMAKDRPGVYASGEFRKRDEAIDKTYNLKLATLKLQFDTNDLAQKLKDEMNKLDAKIFLEEPTFKNLELQGKLFTATAAEGMVDLDNIYNQSLIDQRNATNRYEKEINETKANRLLDEKQKEERIKNIRENAILEQNVINETAYRGYRKGTLQNQKLVLDIEVKMSDSAKILLEGRANIAKNLGLDLAAERIDKQVAQLNLANEYKQRKIQVEQDVENLKLSDEDANTLRSNLDAEMSLKTKTIQSQYSELSQVIKSFVGGFKNSFKEFLLSTDDTGKAFGQLLKGLGKSVLDALAEIASKYMTDALFGWLQPPSQQLTVAAQQLIQAATALSSAAAGGMGSTFSPNGLPGDEIFTLMGSGSGIGSFTSGFEFPDISQLGAADFGSLDLGGIDFSGFANGGMITEDTLGKIENFANGGIIGAMSKERSLTGRTPHLVVASEGERILNHKETAIWNRLQSGVAGFADGGIVGGKGEIASRIGSTTTVNVPVSVSVSNDSEVDSGRLSQTVQALVSDGIRRELRPGGSISRGNPYRR